MESESILPSKPFYICLNTKISSPLIMLAPFFSFSHWEFSGNVRFCLPRTKRSLKVGASLGGVENSTVNRAILQHTGNILLYFPCSNLINIYDMKKSAFHVYQGRICSNLYPNFSYFVHSLRLYGLHKTAGRNLNSIPCRV